MSFVGVIRDGVTDKDALYIDFEDTSSISSCTVPAFSNPYADKVGSLHEICSKDTT